MVMTEKEKLERRKVRLTMRAIAHEIVAELIASNLRSEGVAHDEEICKELERIEERMRTQAEKLEDSALRPPKTKEKEPKQPRKGIREEITLDVSKPDFEVSKRRSIGRRK